MAADLQRHYPDYEFSLIGEVDKIPNAARARRAFGSPSKPPALTGMDVVVAANGRIRATYHFLDGAEL